MNILIFCLISGIFGTEVSLTGVLPETDSLIDVPKGALDGDPHLIQEETATVPANTVMEGRQSDEDYEDTTISTTPHWTEQGCSQPNEYFNACGPRCYQTCSFQQRANGRTTRAVCESIFSGSCHAGCFCQDGYVRFNNKCIKPVDCPTRLCLANEEYKVHGTPCQLTCDSYPYAEEIESRCPSDIPISGCFCKHGYVRSATGSCILPNRCPRPLVS